MTVGLSVQAEPVRNQILVYYANETTARTASSETYGVLLAGLRGSTDPEARAIARILDRDATAFPAAVQADIAALTEAARRLRFDLAIFTNALAYERQYLFVPGAGGSGAIESRRLRELAPAANAILADSPLSRSDFLLAALLEVASPYPFESLDVVLITHSHGAGDIALTPRVFVDLSKTGPGRVPVFDGRARAGELRPIGTLVQGITKLEYWQALAEAGAKHGVRFALVFRQACESGLSGWSELRALPDNVGVIAHTADGGIDYRDIDYAAVFAHPARNFSLVDHLSAELSKRGIYLSAREDMWIWLVRNAVSAALPYLLFVPLLLWLAWYRPYLIAAVRRRASRKAA